MEASGCSTGDSGVSPWLGQSVVSRHVADLNVAVAVRHGEDALVRGWEPKTSLVHLVDMIH